MTRTMTEPDRIALGRQAGNRWYHPPLDEGWRIHAACRGENPELFFPDTDGHRHYTRETRALTAQARALCARCSVCADCLAYALAVDLRYGIWGGLTSGERANLTGQKAD